MTISKASKKKRNKKYKNILESKVNTKDPQVARKVNLRATLRA
jgi:hypothetical protein